MKASKNSIGRSVDQPDPKIRVYLFYGQDEAQSRALAARLLEALGASKIVIPAASIKADPGSLALEAGSMSLFGEARAIWIEPGNDDVAEGVDATLKADATEVPVIVIGGALRKSSVLVKLVEGSGLALAFVTYLPEGKDAERMVIDAGRRVGLVIPSPVAARLAASCGSDQAIVTRELEKLSIYLDASTHAPKELDHESIDAVGAESNDGDFLRLADLALRGEAAALVDQLQRLSDKGTEAVPVVRSLQRRLLMLAPIRARIERGERLDAVMASMGKSLFWKDQPAVGQMLAKWNAEELARAADRAGALERELIFSDVPEVQAIGEELLTIARKARRR